MPDRIVIEATDESEFGEQLTASLDRGGLHVSVCGDYPFGSYNRQIDIAVHLTIEQAITFRDWLVAYLPVDIKDRPMTDVAAHKRLNSYIVEGRLVIAGAAMLVEATDEEDAKRIALDNLSLRNPGWDLGAAKIGECVVTRIVHMTRRTDHD